MTTPLPKIAEVLRRKRTFSSTITHPCPVKGCDNEMDYRDRVCEACLLAAADALDAVGRLPVGGDGEPLILGDITYYDNRDGSLGREVHGRQGATEPHEIVEMVVTGLCLIGNADASSSGLRLIGLCGDGSSISTHGDRLRCYSTRALAEAAAKETTDGQA